MGTTLASLQAATHAPAPAVPPVEVLAAGEVPLLSPNPKPPPRIFEIEHPNKQRIPQRVHAPPRPRPAAGTAAVLKAQPAGCAPEEPPFDLGDPRAFVELVRSDIRALGSEHRYIPPRRYPWQSDVETVHRLVKDEFCDRESFLNPSDFWVPIITCWHYFNLVRPNRGKEWQSPLQILQARAPAKSSLDSSNLQL